MLYLTKPSRIVLFLDQKYLIIYIPIVIYFLLLKFLLVHTFSCMFYVRILITGRLSSCPCVPCISTRFNCSALGRCGCESESESGGDEDVDSGEESKKSPASRGIKIVLLFAFTCAPLPSLSGQLNCLATH